MIVLHAGELGCVDVDFEEFDVYYDFLIRANALF